MTLMVVVFYLIMSFTELLRSRVLVQAGIRFDQHLNSRVFNASFEAYLRRNQINPTEAFGNLNKLRQFLTGNGIFVFFDLPWTPIFIYIVFILHPYLGCLTLILVGIQICLVFWSSRRGQALIEEEIQKDKKSQAYLQAKLKNVEPIQAMGMLGNLQERWLDLFNEQQKINLKNQHQQHLQQAIIKFLRYAMQSLTLAAGALLVIKGELSAGAMIAVNLLMTRALQPLDLIVSSWRGFIDAKDAFLKLESIMHEYPKRNSLTQLSIPNGSLSIEHLCAFSPDKKKQILHDITLNIAPGRVLCVIGQSGSGKSTLARCLVGVWPDSSGQILLDGISLDNWDKDKLGPSIGYLPQDVELFDGTIAENISRFYEINPDLVIEAAKKSGVHEMILRLPNGYDTAIGYAGSFLSGGQRQRIALARAMYGNPQLVVLDEPNANLDDMGERALVIAIQNMRAENKTIVLVTHRLNILTVADDILIMHDGKVSSYGSGQQILEQMRLNRSVH